MHGNQNTPPEKSEQSPEQTSASPTNQDSIEENKDGMAKAPPPMDAHVPSLVHESLDVTHTPSRVDLMQSRSPVRQSTIPVVPSSPQAVDEVAMDDQTSSPIILEPDGSIISPPSSPLSTHPFDSESNSPPSSDSFYVHFNSETHLHHPSKITHLLALPAIHHPRPVNTKTYKKLTLPRLSTNSKFPLSANPFACLDMEPSSTPPQTSFHLLPTLPAEGSLLPVGVKPTQ